MREKNVDGRRARAYNGVTPREMRRKGNEMTVYVVLAMREGSDETVNVAVLADRAAAVAMCDERNASDEYVGWCTCYEVWEVQ